eukprot:PhF_6_TR6445/c0_g1_i1/m.9663
MDFDDCPPPLPPPELEKEEEPEVPEEPPMTAMDGNGGDAWIMRGINAMRQHQSSVFEPSPDAIAGTVSPPPAAYLEPIADANDDIVPPPLYDAEPAEADRSPEDADS